MNKVLKEQFKAFSFRVISGATSVKDRAVCFIWFRIKTNLHSASIAELKDDFLDAGLGKQMASRLRNYLKYDRRTVKTGKDAYTIRADKLDSVEKQFNLNSAFDKIKKNKKRPLKRSSHEYVDSERINSIQELKSKEFDFSRLHQMLKEINEGYESENYITIICLLRAVLDHVPPIFGVLSFSQVANNYNGGRSFNRAMKKLEVTSRNIADMYLHAQIRKAETLPNQTQVDFSNDLDLLLAEIVRIVKHKSSSKKSTIRR